MGKKKWNMYMKRSEGGIFHERLLKRRIVIREDVMDFEKLSI